MAGSGILWRSPASQRRTRPDQPELLGDPGKILERIGLLALAALVSDLARIRRQAEEPGQQHEAG